ITRSAPSRRAWRRSARRGWDEDVRTSRDRPASVSVFSPGGATETDAGRVRRSRALPSVGVLLRALLPLACARHPIDLAAFLFFPQGLGTWSAEPHLSRGEVVLAPDDAQIDRHAMTLPRVFASLRDRGTVVNALLAILTESHRVVFGHAQLIPLLV